MIEYHPMTCICGVMIEPELRQVEKPKRAKTWRSCNYRCECGVGYSNAQDEAMRRRIMRSPRDNVPLEVRSDLDRVLSEAINQRNRQSKKMSFCSQFSEDAVTWTVFKFLLAGNQVGIIPRMLGWEPPRNEPRICLWGVPLRTDRDNDLHQRFIKASDELDEASTARSEPDVMLDWPELTMLIEVKYGSVNPVQSDYVHFGKYLDLPDLWAVPVREVERAGFYELARNWRFAAAIADGKPFGLMNLGPERILESAAEFAAQLARDENRRFRGVAWDEFLEQVQNRPAWLDEFLLSRKLIV